jgi:hypothetical protein
VQSKRFCLCNQERVRIEEDTVTRTLLSAAVLCLALSSAAIPSAAKAEPRALTDPELAGVTAGVAMPPIQINVNTTAQVAVAVPVAVAVCAVCDSPAVIAVAKGTAFNINLAQLVNSN